MKALVIDASAALGFVLRDENDASALKTLEIVESGVPTFVPGHWRFEVANGLLMAERRKRASQADIAEALALLAALPLQLDLESSTRAFAEVVGLARQAQLTVYDAAYLELAMRKGAALATADSALRKAATHVGLALVDG